MYKYKCYTIEPYCLINLKGEKMDITKCDKCGKELARAPEFNFFFSLCINDKKNYDLCTACNKKFKAWLKQ